MHALSSRQLAAAAALTLLFFGGCPSQTPKANPGPSAAPAAKVDANELLEAMRATYRDAKTYSDTGTVSWQMKSENGWTDGSEKFATAFERPNRCAVEVRGLELTCDGRRLRATIDDPRLGDYSNQMLDAPAPPSLTVGALLTDATMVRALTDWPIDNMLWPLRMLTVDDGVERLLAGKLKLLPDDALDGRKVHRVEITQSGRRTVLWIEATTHLLRRVELPDPDAALGMRNAVADFKSPQVNGKIDPERFERKVPAETIRVQMFVAAPPLKKLPSPLLGEQVGDFTFEKTDGALLKRDALKGQIVVLAWFDQNPASRLTLEMLQASYDKHKANDKVRFFAVTPPGPMTNQALQQQLNEWKITFPLLRDELAVGRDVFKIAGAPTVVVIDGQHRVQEFIERLQPLLGQLLSPAIDSLLAGGNPAGELRQMIAEDAADFRRQLAAAKVAAQATVIDLTPTDIVPARDPERLTLTKLWTCTELASPGNILVVENENAAPTLLVIDHTKDWKTFVELSETGKVAARHQLALPQNAAITALRTAVDAAGRRWFVGSSRLAKQAFIVDDKWEVAASYPSSDVQHEGIGDFALVDFKSDGQLQLVVGFWGPLGTHGANLAGERQWSNRNAAPVVSLAVSPPDAADRKQILATTDRGEIVPINGFGISDPPKRVEHQAITNLVASQLGSRAIVVYMGLAPQADSSQIATALSEKLEPMWDVPLPAGVHHNHIQPVISGRLLDGDVGQWLFAGADGSIGIVSDDAKFFDSLAFGKQLFGFAIAQLGEQHVLLTSSKGEVTAWGVKAK